MKNVLLLIAFISTLSLSAKSFRTLSSIEAVKESYTASSKVKIDVNLILQIENKDYQKLPLIIQYRVNDSEFRDFMDVEAVKRGLIKSIQLKEGDYFEAAILINAEDSVSVDQIRGSLTLTVGMKSFASADNKQYDFTGDLWRMKESPLFRVVKKDADAQKIKFTITTTDSYSSDKLFVRVKVIHPADGMKKISKTIIITDEEFLPVKGNSYEFVLDGVSLNAAGNYYFEIKHQHTTEWINGVGSVSYQLLD